LVKLGQNMHHIQLDFGLGGGIGIYILITG